MSKKTTRQKGEPIGSKTIITRYAESTPNNTNNQFNVRDLDVDHGQGVVVELSTTSGDHIDTYDATVRESKKFVKIPNETIRREGINPGVKISATLYEERQTDFIDSSEVIDRCSAPKSGEGVDSRLASIKAWEHLKEGPKPLKLRNVRTGDSVVVRMKPYQARGHVSFTKEARDPITAEPGDMIEIIDPAKTDAEDIIADVSEDEKIDEIYEMVSEIYDAYLEVK